MKRIVLFLLIVFYIPQLNAAQEKAAVETVEKEALEIAPEPFATHGLLIFLDTTSETGDQIGVFGGELLTALDQKAGPIIASGLLIRDIIKQPNPSQLVAQKKAEKDDFADDYQQELELYERFLKDSHPAFAMPAKPQEIADKIRAATKDYAQKLDNAWPQLKTSFVKAATHFDANEWIIKQINPHLLLLVPKWYLEQINKTNLARFYSSTSYSATELNLGIQIDHKQMQTIDSINAYADAYQAPEKDEPDSFLIRSLNDIFITRNEYTKELVEKTKVAPQPQWVIYMGGHGVSGKYIANLGIESFKTLLNFFETKIFTKLFVYMSCYAAGVSAKKVYYDRDLRLFKTYSFALASGALTDAPASSKWSSLSFGEIKPEDLDIPHQLLKPRNSFNFAQFLEQAASSDLIDFPKLLENVLTGAQQGPEARYIFSLPQLKLPGIPWFNVVDTYQKVVSIGRVLAAAHGAERPLNIMTFFQRKVEPMAILLYANVIPFEIQIPLKTMPLLISMIPGNTAHKIKKISIDTTFKEFAASFKPLEKISAKKLFWIEELETVGLLQQGVKTTLYDVLILLEDGKLTYALSREPNKGLSFTWDPVKFMLLPAPIKHEKKINLMIKKAPKFEKELKPKKLERSIERIRKAQEFKIEQIRQAQEKEENKDPK